MNLDWSLAFWSCRKKPQNAQNPGPAFLAPLAHFCGKLASGVRVGVWVSGWGRTSPRLAGAREGDEEDRETAASWSLTSGLWLPTSRLRSLRSECESERERGPWSRGPWSRAPSSGRRLTLLRAKRFGGQAASPAHGLTGSPSFALRASTFAKPATVDKTEGRPTMPPADRSLPPNLTASRVEARLRHD